MYCKFLPARSQKNFTIFSNGKNDVLGFDRSVTAKRVNKNSHILPLQSRFSEPRKRISTIPALCVRKGRARAKENERAAEENKTRNVKCVFVSVFCFYCVTRGYVALFSLSLSLCVCVCVCVCVRLRDPDSIVHPFLCCIACH